MSKLRPEQNSPEELLNLEQMQKQLASHSLLLEKYKQKINYLEEYLNELTKLISSSRTRLSPKEKKVINFYIKNPETELSQRSVAENCGYDPSHTKVIGQTKRQVKFVREILTENPSFLKKDAENLVEDLEELYNASKEKKPSDPKIKIYIVEELQKYLLGLLQLDKQDDTVEFYEGKNNEIEQRIFYEGHPTEVISTKYERDEKARKKCLEKHGYKCLVCKFDFEESYGEIGKQFIHVHHLEPLSKQGKYHKVDPEKDLVPVCPNCHAMIHYKTKKPRTIEEIKNFLLKNEKI